MKTEKTDAEKLQNSTNETTNYQPGEEDERLNLDELLDVQGGIEDNQNSVGCGLGCFTGAMSLQNPTNRDND